jgi:hypothetical protein
MADGTSAHFCVVKWLMGVDVRCDCRCYWRFYVQLNFSHSAKCTFGIRWFYSKCLNALENDVYRTAPLCKFQSCRCVSEVAESAVSFVMSVRLPVCVREKLCSHWKDIYQISCWEYLLKYAEKILGWLQLNKIVRHFAWRPKHVHDNMAVNSCRNKREVSGKRSRENKNTHYMWGTSFCENPATGCKGRTLRRGEDSICIPAIWSKNA